MMLHRLLSFTTFSTILSTDFAFFSNKSGPGTSGNSFDRWIQRTNIHDDSAITKMQHQFWVTKQALSRKLGKKEDECIVASDAELDAKLELFHSIQKSCLNLQRIIDKYQERLCCKLILLSKPL